MDFSEISFFEWVTLLIGVVSAGSTATLAILVFLWTKNSEKNQVSRNIQSEWRDYNLAILSNEDLQQIEADNHLYGDLSALDVKKMCIYFIKINVPYNMWIASKSSLLNWDSVDREISNQAALLSKDKEFVKTHVFPRGYEPEFCDLFLDKWRQEVKTGSS